MNFSTLSKNQRISLVVIALLVLGIAGFAVFKILKNDYLPIYQHDDLAKVADVTALLDEQAIPYQLSMGGSQIEVPSTVKDQVNLSLAKQNYGVAENNGFELFDNIDYSMTEQAQKITLLRALQGELERTLEAYQEIELARVHLAIPEKKLFADNQQAGSAAVSLWFVNGQNFNQKQVLSVRQLVASSVEGLVADNVVVLDGYGVQISKQDNQTNQAFFMEHKSSLEGYYQEKATELLSLYFNVSQFVVSVSVELNDKLTKEVSQEIVVPEANGQGFLTRKKESKSSKSGSLSSDKDTDSTIEVEYQHGNKTQESVTQPGGVRQISAAVALSADVSPESVAKLRSLIFAGLGLSHKRSDMLSIEVIAPVVQRELIQPEPRNEVVPASLKQSATEISKSSETNDIETIFHENLIWIIAGFTIFVLLVGFMLFTRETKQLGYKQNILALEQWYDNVKEAKDA